MKRRGLRPTGNVAVLHQRGHARRADFLFELRCALRVSPPNIAALLVVGDETSTQFPKGLTEFRQRQGVGMKVNLLVNYGWEWDLAGLKNGGLRSDEVSRLDLIVRWGGGRRLSGFLPVQSVYADFYVRDDYWPDFDPRHLEHALAWYKKQDQTLGG